MQLPLHYHGNAIAMPWHCQGDATATPWHWQRHGIATAMPWHSHGNAMALPWQCHGIPMAMPCRGVSENSLWREGSLHQSNIPPGCWWSGRWSIGSAPKFLCRMQVFSRPGLPGRAHWSLGFHGTTMVYVLPWSLYYHYLCTTMVYLLPSYMCCHRLCPTMVYVPPWSMY